MPDTTPAAELRAAAALLRTHATTAHRSSPAPWTVTDEYVVRCADGMIVADRSGTDHPAERADLPYIAAMDPGVGRALADWLDAAAVGYDATVTGAASVWTDPADAAERDAWVARQTDQHALAVARQVLGTPTTDPAPTFNRMPCSLATLHRPHPPHTWEPQPGMTPLACPGTPASAPAAPADRAAVLREAGAAIVAEDLPGCYWAANLLRRLADEAQPTETEAAPQCTAGLLPATGEAVDRCIRRGKHDSHKTASGALWGNGSADVDQPAAAATEEPQPPKPAPCTATLAARHVASGIPVICTREARHPGNHVGPRQDDYGRALWEDWHDGATPHRAAP